jgi:hypothetical protein
VGGGRVGVGEIEPKKTKTLKSGRDILKLLTSPVKSNRLD